MPALVPVSTPLPQGLLVTWPNIAPGNTGANAPEGFVVPRGQALGAAIQVEGTFGGATIALQRSLDGESWHPVDDLSGEDLSLTAAGITDFSTAALHLRPVISGGSGSSITVTLCLWS